MTTMSTGRGPGLADRLSSDGLNSILNCDMGPGAERVACDVRLGFVSKKAARRDYGVVLDDDGARPGVDANHRS